MTATTEDVQRFGILTGFQRGLDWRPIEFVDVLPPQWVCNLCGRITEETTILPCSHRLCLLCLRGCRATSPPLKGAQSFSCVLDGAPVPRNEPRIGNHCNAEAVFTLKVKCWNSTYGCRFVGPLADLLDHFEKDCAFHAVTCQRCHTPVLLARLPAHNRLGCRTQDQEAEARRPAEQSASHGSPELIHDTLASLESRMNELVECVKDIDSKSSLLVSSFDEARELLKALASAGSRTDVRSPIDGSVQASATGPGPDFLQTPSEQNRLHAAITSLGWAFPDYSQDTPGPAQNTSFALQPEGRSERFQSMPSGTEPAQLTRFLSEGGRVIDRERRALLVSFKITKPSASSSGSDFLPLYDLLKRGIELSIPETWTTRLELDNQSCQVKLVILEENSALDVYGKVEERRRTFNPWKIESVRLAHPSEGSPLATDSETCIEPTWTNSRAARLKLQGSGYCHYGSNRFEAMCRRGFVVGDDTVKFRVTLVRKWTAPPVPSAARAQSLSLSEEGDA